MCQFDPQTTCYWSMTRQVQKRGVKHLEISVQFNVPLRSKHMILAYTKLLVHDRL